MRNSSKSYDEIHLKILPTLSEVLLRYLSYCPMKVFNDAHDKINEFSNFKYNLTSRFNKLQDTATELGSEDTFLKTWNSLLNCYQSLINNLIYCFLFVMPQSNSKNTNITVSQYCRSFRLIPLKCLHKYFILKLFFVCEIHLRRKFD